VEEAPIKMMLPYSQTVDAYIHWGQIASNAYPHANVLGDKFFRITKAFIQIQKAS